MKNILKLFLAGMLPALRGCEPAYASTVVGNLITAGGDSTVKFVRFMPRSTPLSNGVSTVLGYAVRADVDTNNNFSAKLVGGFYDTYFGNDTLPPLRILVPPNDTNTWTLNQVAQLAVNASMFGIASVTISTGGTNGGVSVAAGTGITVTVSGGTNTISLYSAPTITAFANNQNPQEVGATVTSTLLTWTRGGGPVTSLMLDNSIGSLATNLTSYSHTSSYTTARTYILTASDGTTAATASTTVNFYSKIYWGASAQTASTITDGQIIALSGSAYATARTMTQTITTASNYMFVCYPAAWGVATFKVGGFDDTGWNLVTRNFTNASGGVVSYNIYQHWPANIGNYSVEVK